MLERKMNSSRQWGNEGKLGFFPTSKKIVELEMSLIDFSELEYSDIKLNICDLSGGEGDQLHWTSKYLNDLSIKNECYYNEIAEQRFSVCKEKYPYFKHCKSDIFSLKITSNNTSSKKVFSIIRNNPPYMWLNRYGENKRAEYEFFIKNSTLDIDGAIHIFEIPIHQLLEIKNILNIIAYRYEFEIFKFPEEEFKNFKQCVVICKKKKSFFRDNDRVVKVINKLLDDDIEYLDKVTAPIFKLDINDMKKTPQIKVFKDGTITEESLMNGLNQVINDLYDSDRRENTVKEIKRGKPIIELLQGHISQILAAGGYNGVLGSVLVKGGTVKEIVEETIEEDNSTTVVATEVLKPYLEITNKNGDLIYKVF